MKSNDNDLRLRELRFAGDDPCRPGHQHDDPDNSGMCYRCGAIMDPDAEDVVEAMEDGRAPASMPDAVNFAAESFWTVDPTDLAIVHRIMEP